MKTKNNFRFLVSSIPFLSRRSFRRKSYPVIPAPACVGFPSLGRRHSDAPACNSEQQLRRERHLEGNSCQYGLEQRGQLGCRGPPNGPADTATFATSNIRRPVISATTEVNGIVFNPGASAFTITSPFFSFTISGVGITNNSGITQNFVSGPTVINFLNNATAGSLTHFTNTGDIHFRRQRDRG